MAAPTRQDWTTGPARFIAAGALGGASIVGLAWVIASGRAPLPREPSPAPRPVEARPESPAPPHLDPIQQAAPAPSEQRDSAARPPPRADEPVQAAPPPDPEPAPPEAAPVLIVNINTASAAELELLPGIGPALAQRIIEYRAKHGRFRRVDDLDAVRGIGPRTLERLRPLVRVD